MLNNILAKYLRMSYNLLDKVEGLLNRPMSHNRLKKVIHMLVNKIKTVSSKIGTIKMAGFERIMSHASYQINT